MKLAGLTGGAGILASCSSAAEPEAEEPMGEETGEEVSEAPAAAETVEITFTGWGGEEEDQGVQDAIKVFEEETPNIKVTWIHIPDNYAEKTMAMVAAGTPPDTSGEEWLIFAMDYTGEQGKNKKGWQDFSH